MTDNQPIRIAIIGATFETANMGVGALAAGAIKCVLSEYPEADVFFLDYGRERTVHTVRANATCIRVPLVNMRFSRKFYLSNNIVVLMLSAFLLKILPTRRLRDWMVGRNACLREIHQADLFASVAGGDSFSDIYGLSRFLYISLPQILVLLLGKRLLLLPQTYGPFRGRITKSIARHIVARAERAYCRDYRSLDQLMDHPDEDRPRHHSFCYDMAFDLDPIKPATVETTGLSLETRGQGLLVGLNVSGLLYMGGYTRKNAFGLRLNYPELIKGLVDLLISSKEATVLLIPHVFGTDTGSESDVLACERVFAALQSKYPGRLGVLRGWYDQNQIKHIIGQCDFFVGSRMHACIGAVSQNVPAVAIAYSDKFLGVMETIGISWLAADARKLAQDEVLQAVDDAFEHRQFIASELKEKMPDVKKTVSGLFRGIDVGSKNARLTGPKEAVQVSAR